MNVLFAAPARLWEAWAPALRAACPEMELTRQGDPASFDVLIYAPGYPEDGGVLEIEAVVEVVGLSAGTRLRVRAIR